MFENISCFQAFITGYYTILMLSAVFYVVIIILCTTSAEDLSIPLNVVDADSVSTLKHFVFQSDDLHVEVPVAKFCLENVVDALFCKVLFEEALYKQVQYDAEPFSNVDVDKQYEAFDRLMPNYLLKRHTIPVVKTSIVGYNDVDGKAALELIFDAVDSIPNRYVVLHSCTFPGSASSRIIVTLLDQLQASRLMFESNAYIIVLNYGAVISQTIKEQYLEVFNQKMVWIEVSTSITSYEVPTLRFIHSLSEQLVLKGLHETQILYLHTKGASYVEHNQVIEDWRDLMMYFLVERYNTCYHLLASCEFDTVGVNFNSSINDSPHYSGNFWWATAKYISTLPLLPYSEHKHINKHSAEYWILSAFDQSTPRGVQPKRVYNLHSSNINHYELLYPRSSYVVNV